MRLNLLIIGLYVIQGSHSPSSSWHNWGGGAAWRAGWAMANKILVVWATMHLAPLKLACVYREISKIGTTT